jgi:hypothetical protein
MRGAHPYTREQHAAIEAKRGRPVTDGAMRAARHHDDDVTDSGLSIVDRVVADSRRAGRAS